MSELMVNRRRNPAPIGIDDHVGKVAHEIGAGHVLCIRIERVTSEATALIWSHTRCRKRLRASFDIDIHH
jgi:hypothetical protein